MKQVLLLIWFYDNCRGENVMNLTMTYRMNDNFDELWEKNVENYVYKRILAKVTLIDKLRLFQCKKLEIASENHVAEKFAIHFLVQITALTIWIFDNIHKQFFFLIISLRLLRKKNFHCHENKYVYFQRATIL